MTFYTFTNVLVFAIYLGLRSTDGCETFLSYFVIIDFIVSMLAAVNCYYDYSNKNRMELLTA